jgi:phage terminase large subunit-like protein
MDICENFNIINTGFDKWRQSHGTIQDLLNHGFYMTEVQQSYHTLTEPIEEFLRLGTTGDIKHYMNPVMRWMVSNLEIKRKGDQKLFDKSKVQNKIDGVAALINALAVKINEADPEDLQIYGL